MGSSGIFQNWTTTRQTGVLQFPTILEAQLELAPTYSFGTGELSKWIRPPMEQLSVSPIGSYPWGAALFATNQKFEAISGEATLSGTFIKKIVLNGNKIAIAFSAQNESSLQSFVRVINIILPALLSTQLQSPVSIQIVTMHTPDNSWSLELKNQSLGAFHLRVQDNEVLANNALGSIALIDKLVGIYDPLAPQWHTVTKALMFFQKSVFLYEACGESDLFFSEIGLNLFQAVEAIEDHLKCDRDNEPRDILCELFEFNSTQRELIDILFQVRSQLDWAHGGGRPIPLAKIEMDAIRNLIPQLLSLVAAFMAKALHAIIDGKIQLTSISEKTASNAQTIYERIKKLTDAQLAASDLKIKGNVVAEIVLLKPDKK
ncbi:MAG: hypothetical protein ABL958_15990 [Bdellovibrionia bacterium]